ncbi:DUF2264 domain-containing protein [Photobacterium gaetbulicola]|uniref:DUF2264 domain-containing protein n=1 Tax=Photobacterium gaetbulicola Gung47 TaxID=658445 RepID=A0A0C5WMU2_9GAMM|nr:MULTISPECIES: DUF2264 domain-containing protein [Photobacterium]AJR08458.1 hypothetical protein H744_2c1792 [Photobacterium gaetbulicola Gung47]PSU12038.1 DUF2264 domain-containing protein [Photobacterium gaetbulicola]WEM43683.1 DUF2264 domain-containing protein [Photobacterium sp. DA100]
MQKTINATERPIIPYEHPDTAIYLRLFKENLTRLRYRKAAYSQHDDYIRQQFSTVGQLRQQCDDLVRYVAEAFEHYAVWDYTHAYYPGRPSQQNARTDAMEGCSRVIPTLAAWLSRQKGTSTMLNGLNGQPLDIALWLKKAFLAGTDPAHPGYWGELHDYDQRICESADLALALWLSRETVWTTLTYGQQKQIVAWFKQVNHCQTVDNNWHLFPLTVQLVINSLTGEDHFDHTRYHRIKEFYVGDGWFRDGAKGNYDYYNAWGFYYSLYWFDQIDPSFDPEFIRASLQAFSKNYRAFFTPVGLPLFGRSACYRLAASAPLLAAVDLNRRHSYRGGLHLGEAKRAFRTSLEYFISHGALQYGAPTQGLFGDDARLVDNYSGPASSFWSLRALNIALYCGDRLNLWQAEEHPLEIERGDFSFEIPAIEAKVIGTFKTKEVVVIFQSEYCEQQDPLSRRLERQKLARKIQEILTGRAERPKNNLLRKGITCYSSKMSHFF